MDVTRSSAIRSLRETYIEPKQESTRLAGKRHLLLGEQLCARNGFRDCAVIEYLHLKRIERGLKLFDSVCGVFIEEQELYPGAGFHDKNHIQICIRNPNCIKGFFLPRNEVKWN